MRVFFICITSLFINGCGKISKDESLSDKERLSNDLISNVAMQLKMKKNLRACGFGGRAMDKIKMLYLAFDYFNQIEIEEARELMINAGNFFLKTINEDDRIRPYLYNYPFQPKNIGMRIFFKKPDGSEVDTEKLCLIALGEGKLRYETNDAETHHLVTMHTETYEEATNMLGLSVSF